jgi:signal transduction histidine kinase/CheY-like chemotaxis protein
MSMVITRVEIRYEQDVVYARQRARLISELLGFDRNDQTRVSTAVSEIARNAYQYGGGGWVEFFVDGTAPDQILAVTVRDRGPGIKDIQAVLEGRYTSPSGMGLGIVGARRLMDRFHVETRPGEGATVFLGKTLPLSAQPVTSQALARVNEILTKTLPESPLEEIRLQNHELLRTLEELRRRQEELEQLNRELDDTNRGVVALYAELDERATELSRVNQLQSRFLSNMSHEFRTPLNSTLALSRLLLDRVDGDLNAEQEKQVVFIRKAAEDLSALVSDLLDLAKIQAGRVEVRPDECMAEEIFSGLRGMLKPLLANKALELVFEPPEGVPPLFTDEGKVTQILRNFLSNAFKFTERGEIRVSARLSDDGRAVLFAVADTGIGIPPEDQHRIFDEYAQVETAQLGKPKGAGLGLAISRRLAELLGGRVLLESRPGVGSTFTAAIPLRYAPAEAEPAAALTPDITRYSVLVVEDDAATQLLYEKYLQGSGFQVFPAHSIRSARQVMERVKPMAIVLDFLMPSETEDGWTFLTEIKRNDATREIPVIAVTVLEERDKGLALGVEDYCVKPVERKWLLDKLRNLTRRMPHEKVLIIDDEEVARYLFKGRLADTRYAVLEAADGAQGLRLAEAEQPSVIFLDLMMPGMSGFEVLQRLKDNRATRDIPVIICTAKVLDEADRRTLNQHVLAVLSKETRSLKAAVQTVHEALRQAAELHERKERNKYGR